MVFSQARFNLIPVFFSPGRDPTIQLTIGFSIFREHEESEYRAESCLTTLPVHLYDHADIMVPNVTSLVSSSHVSFSGVNQSYSSVFKVHSDCQPSLSPL